ncbi:hypothetical protein DRA42_04795 [Ethanoligenens harbinense]|nr:hypothetical protein CXQ68_04785 [Ethanoligenens harbinense YUAN-3]AYF38274.1 hypothetical protein CXP51_04645 [Ethanoligenens harbinense]AYF41020.1 hypothetical protein CN246_04780 [Ethanoligenens harbinense]QCN91850.1 hypothetical protein DRA42_04795 [Ethanoligenens harbinense]
MQFDGAIMENGGAPFGIVHVTPPIPGNVRKMDFVVSLAGRRLGNIPIVLATRDQADGSLAFFGREDHLRYLSGIPVSDISWKKYTVVE